MSFYERRTVSIKLAGNQALLAQLVKVISLLVEQKYGSDFRINGETAAVDAISEIKCSDTVDFSFEYYTAEAMSEYERLLEMVNEGNVSTALVAYDSDYGSYIETYGDAQTVKVAPDDSEWYTGAIPGIKVTFLKSALSELLCCTGSGLEESLEDCDEETLAEKVFGDLYEAAEVEYSDYFLEGDAVVLSFYTELMRQGTIEDLREQLLIYKNIAEYAKSKGGSALFGQEDMILDPENGRANHTWICESGFKELQLDTIDGQIGEFEETVYSFR